MINIDFKELIKAIIPVRMRSLPFIQFLFVLFSPKISLSEEFYEFYDVKRYEVAFTGQVAYLKHVLDDQFDPYLRRIRIENVELDNVVIYNNIEDEPAVHIYNINENNTPVYLFNSSEQAFTFIIYVPVGVIDDFDRFRWWVDKYRLKSKLYIIIEE